DQHHDAEFGGDASERDETYPGGDRLVEAEQIGVGSG
ncbi:hypothetical protein GGQ90_005874, partial [Sphingobium scionense]|nr:hypothetical protein [Sphingobium scionense]